MVREKPMDRSDESIFISFQIMVVDLGIFPMDLCGMQALCRMR